METQKPSAARLALLAVLVSAGVGTAWWSRAYRAGSSGFDAATAIVLGVAAVALLLPGVRRGLMRGLDALRDARPARVAVALFILAAAELTASGLSQRSYLGPKSHDEHSYTLGAMMLAVGRLWTQSPAAADSFESFHILTKPVYASIYAPGVALLHVPGVWAGVPGWVTAVALTALAIAMVYVVLRPALGGDLAAVAALMALGTPQLRSHSFLTMSQVPSLLLGCAVLAAAWVWAKSPTRGRAAVVGAIGGLLLMVRPQDAACFLPGAAALTLTAIGTTGLKRWARQAAIALLAMTPAVGLMAVQNWGLTGSPLRTGYWEYTQAMQPGTGFFSDEPTTQPRTALKQKEVYNETFGGVRRQQREEGVVRDWAVRRVPIVLRDGVPAVWLAGLVPLGIVGLWGRPMVRGLSVAGLAFAGVYGAFTFFEAHYVVPMTVLVVGVSVAAAHGVRRVVPAWGDGARLVVAVLGVAGAVRALPEVNPAVRDWQMRTEQLRLADAAEAKIERRPALLLIRYTPPVTVHQEPVYNLKSWRIEENEVIRAHDLGDELNGELFRTLSARGPRRFVYHLDRATGEFRELGWADELGAGR